MVDINNEEYLKKLHKAAASDDGQVIIEYLKHESEKFDYETLEATTFENLGIAFEVCRSIKQYFKDVLSRFGETLK